MAFVDFGKVKSTDLFKTVSVPSWGGDVRLNRPSALELLPLIAMQETFEKDEDGQLLNDGQSISFAIALLSKMIADESGELQFDSDEGRARLSHEFAAIQSLVGDATSFCGLNDDDQKKSAE